MKHLKKVLSLCLALAMIFSLAACSQQPAVSESTATPEVTAEATAEPTPEATPEETPEEKLPLNPSASTSLRSRVRLRWA